MKEQLFVCVVIGLLGRGHHVQSTEIWTEGDVRLLDGSVPSEGRVEFYWLSEWHVVCDDYWDLKDANVVCRQLGYPAASEVVPRSGFGDGKGEIVLDDLMCTGYESSLKDCGNNGFFNHDCWRDEIAGVVCATGARIELKTSLMQNFTDDLYDESSPAYRDLESKFSLAMYDMLKNATSPENIVKIKVTGFRNGSVIVDWLLTALQLPEVVTDPDQMVTNGNFLRFIRNALQNGIDNGILQGLPGNVNSVVVISITYVTPEAIHPAQTSTDPPTTVTYATPEAIPPAQTSTDPPTTVTYVTPEAIPPAQTPTDPTTTVTYLTPEAIPPAQTPIDRPKTASATNRWRADYRCGGEFLAPNGEIAECDPEGTSPCCSPNNWCDLTASHCECEGCIDYRVTETPTSSQLRLVGGNDAAGRVEIYLDGVWGTVCDDFWDLSDAQVVCRQLGFLRAISAPMNAAFGEGSDPTHLDDVECTGEETDILSCSHTRDENCGHSEDAGVVCSATSAASTSSPDNVRLADGSTFNSGRVEIYYDGFWGTICDENWEKEGANVICRQLGFAGAETLYASSYFGQGSGPILRNLQCFGNEYQWSDCYFSDWNTSLCIHLEDAGVTCRIEGSTMLPPTTITDSPDTMGLGLLNVISGNVVLGVAVVAVVIPFAAFIACSVFFYIKIDSSHAVESLALRSANKDDTKHSSYDNKFVHDGFNSDENNLTDSELAFETVRQSAPTPANQNMRDMESTPVENYNVPETKF